MKKTNKAVIVGAGALLPGDLDFAKEKGDLLLAADAGCLKLEKAGLVPDLLIGDLDSMHTAPEEIPLIRLPVEKDDTDTAYCVKEALKRGYRNILILGGLGGRRLSHSLANVQLLAFIRNAGAEGVLKRGKTEIRLLLKGEERPFPAGKKRDISLFAFGGPAVVTIRGMKYNGESIPLSPSFPLGVSNSLTGTASSVRVHEGSVLLVEE